MWERHSHTLATLTKITSGKVKFKWTIIKQDAFEEIKQVTASNVLLACSYFNKYFEINTNASNLQLVADIS